jgi:hypothetical protein
VLAKPAAAPAVGAPAANAPASAKPSSFFGFGSLKRLTFRHRQASVTITVPGAGTMTAKVKTNIGRRTVRIATASRTATRAGEVRLTLRLSKATERSLRRTLARRPTRRTGGVLQATFARTGGSTRTRNKALSIAIGR